MQHTESFDQTDSNWRSMALAGVGALVVVVVLAAITAVVWSLGSGSNQATALQETAPQTPTPRALSFRKAGEGAPVVAPTQVPAQEPLSVVAEGTPALLSVSIDRGLPTSNVLLLADDQASLAKLAAEDWDAAAPGLVNLGENAAAARWIDLARSPQSNMAVEAEMRVTGTLSTVCDQSFGLVGGSETTGDVFGTGIIFPCSGDSAQARITDVSAWRDGYNVAPVLADAEFDPKSDWHTYRFELQDDEVRLFVDGDEILRGKVDLDIAPSASDIAAGIWSQGVGIEVRRVEVTALPVE